MAERTICCFNYIVNAVAQPFVVRVSRSKNFPSLSSSAQDSFEAMREAILIHMGQVPRFASARFASASA